jgi:GNAT superfamily N-acetyltransferase
MSTPPPSASYRALDRLRDGRPVVIRALRADDRDALLGAAGRMSDEARQLRFFTPKRTFTDAEIDYYVNVDFVSHVALVATVDDGDGPRIVGGGRYILVSPGRAEVAFGVDDTHRGMGIGNLLMRHLGAIAREAGLRELCAEVLPENTAMLKVFQGSGLPMQRRTADGVVHVALALG